MFSSFSIPQLKSRTGIVLGNALSIDSPATSGPGSLRNASSACAETGSASAAPMVASASMRERRAKREREMICIESNSLGRMLAARMLPAASDPRIGLAPERHP